jgi:pantoate--beta-alanine ligase
VALPQALQSIASALRSGATDIAAVELAQADALRLRGWKPDYLTVRRRSDLLVPSTDDLAGRAPLLVLAAAKLGATRLIDNLEFDW